MEKPFEFDRCAGHLALDFANTVSDRVSDSPIERLATFQDLLAFATQCELVSAAEAQRLAARARRAPADAETVLERARALRDALYDLAAAIAEERAPPAAARAELNKAVARLEIDDDWHWAWGCSPGGLDVMLGPITVAAAELLTGAMRERIRMCASDTCAWVFLDTSKNHSRRWCDMKQCGNRAKARRFHARQQGQLP
ncbi:MAG TPA: ABATE domain-containing protein [Kofleriaceae bacterium]|nr:ABATE domain-containing protein [Kofleriaceae bacterium]